MKITAAINFIALAALLASCAPSINSPSGVTQINNVRAGIRLGDEAKPGDLISTSTVAVLGIDKNTKEETLCSASLLPNNIVLSAAHCIKDGMAFYVIFATDIQKADAQSIRHVDAVVVHPQYNENLQDPSNPKAVVTNRNDLSVLHYTGATPTGYKPVQILSDSSVLKNGGQVTVAGYGIGDDTGMIRAAKDPSYQVSEAERGTGVLRSTQVVIKDTQFSQTEIAMDQTSGHGACEGDSGGPAYFKTNNQVYLLGVAAWGPVRAPGSGCLKLAIYTEVFSYIDFINAAGNDLIAHAKDQQPPAETASNK
jgi:secreted trypsin-like serine protease